jgi:hypothetical protein
MNTVISEGIGVSVTDDGGVLEEIEDNCIGYDHSPNCM